MGGGFDGRVYVQQDGVIFVRCRVACIANAVNTGVTFRTVPIGPHRALTARRYGNLGVAWAQGPAAQPWRERQYNLDSSGIWSRSETRVFLVPTAVDGYGW